VLKLFSPTFSSAVVWLILVWSSAAFARETSTLKVITHNVWYGFTKKSTPRHEQWLNWMASQSPDIVSLQELNGYTSDKLAADALAWGHPYSVLLKEDGFATGVTSRFPIDEVRKIREGMHHGLLRCRIAGLWVYVIHFHPSNYSRRVEEAKLLADDIATLPEANPSIILAGDFNGFSPADQTHYQNDVKLVPFFQMLDQRDPNASNLNQGQLDFGGIQAIEAQGFIDLIARARPKDSPLVGTFPTPLVNDENHGTDRRLDYIFVSTNLLPRVVEAKIIRDSVTEALSDHFPVLAIIQAPQALTAPVRMQKLEAPIFEGKPMLLQEHGAGEGPAWSPTLGLLTSGGGHIYRRDQQGQVSIYRHDAGSNGLLFDRQGRLVICEPKLRRVTRIKTDGSTKVLAENYRGMKFNQPNDLAFDTKDRIYFSDPNYGDRSQMELVDSNGRNVEGVYRIDTDGSVTQIISHEVDRPNGLVVTEDDKYLFVADNNNSVGGARKLWRFDLSDNGTVDLATQKLIHDWGTTRGPDGMKLDSVGRLFVAAGLNHPNLPHETAVQPTAGIYVFSAEGTLLQFVPIPRDETTNCAFGSDDLRTLFVTAGGSLWSIRTTLPGKPVWPELSRR